MRKDERPQFMVSLRIHLGFRTKWNDRTLLTFDASLKHINVIINSFPFPFYLFWCDPINPSRSDHTKFSTHTLINLHFYYFLFFHMLFFLFLFFKVTYQLKRKKKFFISEFYMYFLWITFMDVTSEWHKFSYPFLPL